MDLARRLCRAAAANDVAHHAGGDGAARGPRAVPSAFYTLIKVGHLVIYWVLPGRSSTSHCGVAGNWRHGRSGRRRPTSFFPPPVLLVDGEAFDEHVDRFWFELLISEPR